MSYPDPSRSDTLRFRRKNGVGDLLVRSMLRERAPGATWGLCVSSTIRPLLQTHGAGLHQTGLQLRDFGYPPEH